MALKQYKPTSPARRGLILVDKSALWKGKPVKALTEGKRKTGGRNNKGHVTSRGIAGGHKQKYRYVDFKRRTWDVPATVERIEYDPNRSAFIALITYEGGEQKALSIIQYVQEDVAQYGIVVTYMTRPNKTVPYTMEMVGGQWTDTNSDSAAGGVACEHRKMDGSGVA